MIIAATGHRPDKLGGYSNQVRLALGGLATEYLYKEAPEKVISGMAIGWDQAFAVAAMALRIPVIAAVPFEGQEQAWPPAVQEHYRWLLEWSDEVHFVSETPGRRAFQTRNEWMVDRADKMAALWDGSRGGTFNCLEYARKRGVPVDNLWNRWSLPADIRELIS